MSIKVISSARIDIKAGKWTKMRYCFCLIVVMIVIALPFIEACGKPKDEERGEILSFLKYSGIASNFQSLNKLSEDWDTFVDSLETVPPSPQMVDKLNGFHAKAENNYLKFHSLTFAIPTRLSDTINKGIEASKLLEAAITKYLEAYYAYEPTRAMSLTKEGDQLTSQSNTLRMEAWREMQDIAEVYGIDLE